MSKAIPIPLSAKRTDVFTPPSLQPVVDEETRESTGGDRETAFVIRVPTPSERDTIGTRIFEAGLTQVSQETIRATMVDELFRIDWSESNDRPTAYNLDYPEQCARFNEEYADEQAGFLDSYWTRQGVEDQAIALWQEREAERILDSANGVEKEPIEMPKSSISMREHARARLLIDTVVAQSQRIRSLMARQMDYNRLNAQMIVRLSVLGIQPAEGVELPFAADPERNATGLITQEYVDELREYIGDRAWAELVDRIDGHFSLSETERKNSDSPLEKPSDQTGSTEESGASEKTDGSSTALPTGQPPAGESETITVKSSGSRSAPAAAKRKSGRTAKGG